MSHVPRFTVYTVLQDGNAIDVYQTNSAIKAIKKLDSEWAKYEGIRHRHHGVFLTNDPEKGDQDTNVREEAAEDRERHVRLMLWAALVPIIGFLWWFLAFSFAFVRTFVH